MNKHLTGILLPLTDRQQQTLDFMWGFYLENDMLPPCRVTADHFGFAPNAIRDTAKVLVRKAISRKTLLESTGLRICFTKEEAGHGSIAQGVRVVLAAYRGTRREDDR